MTHVRVAIVGAGFAGIGAAMELRRSGETSFVVLERADSVGGTWRDNTYPGVSCDVPSHLYSFASRPNPYWSRLFAPGREIRDYLEGTVDAEGLRPFLRLGVGMTDLRWDEDAAIWRITTTGESMTAETVILACGRLTEPRIPAVPGLEHFPGEHFHSARWRHDLDLAGRRVAVVGTGASAVQLVPRVAEVAVETTVFQRSAPWIVPRPDRNHGPHERALYARDPDALQRLRDDQFWTGEAMYPARAGDPSALEAARAEALDHLERQVGDPDLRRALTPDYEIGCKRRLLSNDFYPALQSGSATLEPTALVRVDPDGALVAASGRRVYADVLVFATGFLSTEQPYAATVHGVGGESLAEHWSEGMTAFASTTVHGFPNLFVLNGPNVGLGHNSAVYMIETQLMYVLQALDHLATTGGVLEVGADAEREYTELIDRLAAATVWLTGGCDSWYVDPRSGRLTLLWPESAAAFRMRNGRFDPEPYAARPRIGTPSAAL